MTCKKSPSHPVHKFASPCLTHFSCPFLPSLFFFPSSLPSSPLVLLHLPLSHANRLYIERASCSPSTAITTATITIIIVSIVHASFNSSRTHTYSLCVSQWTALILTVQATVFALMACVSVARDGKEVTVHRLTLTRLENVSLTALVTVLFSLNHKLVDVKLAGLGLIVHRVSVFRTAASFSSTILIYTLCATPSLSLSLSFLFALTGFAVSFITAPREAEKEREMQLSLCNFSFSYHSFLLPLSHVHSLASNNSPQFAIFLLSIEFAASLAH